MNVVLDASVAIKWFSQSSSEADVDAALHLLRRVREGEVTLIQPPHFVAEVAAVLARITPLTAKRSIADLLEVEMELVDDPTTLAHAIGRAVDLAIQLRQHVFDTLYHAVAFERRDARFVTADDRYYRKAVRTGRIVRLADFARA